MILTEDDFLNALVHSRFYLYEGTYRKKHGIALYEKCCEEGPTVTKRLAVFDEPEQAHEALQKAKEDFIADFKARFHLTKRRIKRNEVPVIGHRDDGPESEGTQSDLRWSGSS